MNFPLDGAVGLWVCMKGERNTSVLAPPAPAVRPAAQPAAIGAGVTARTVEAVAAMLPGSGKRGIAVAPLRLDVLGGLGEYTGGPTLGVSTTEHVAVGVGEQSDGKLRIEFASKRTAKSEFEFPVEESSWAGGGAELLGRFHLTGKDEAAAVFAAVVEGAQAKLFDFPHSGLLIAVAPDRDETAGSRHIPALIAATLAACSAVAGKELDSRKALAVCRRVQTEWLNDTASPADALCALLAQPEALLQIHGDTLSAPPLVQGLTILGLCCGAAHDDDAAKFRHVRVTTFMGRLIIERIFRHDAPKAPAWDGSFAGITMQDFVDRLRDRIPTKMKGRDFLDHFGETGDPLTSIDPDAVYKIRSRTEHHIYEYTRVREFVECLSQASRSHERTHLLTAGAALNASHWSYGQRCGMGSIETDLLVHLFRKGEDGKTADAHQDSDIYAAKISGRGCGGTVAVLMENTDTARHALDRALDEYSRRTRLTTRILEPGLPGALVAGVQHP